MEKICSLIARKLHNTLSFEKVGGRVKKTIVLETGDISQSSYL